ncbi:polysaccharide biosynthesis C-terminal domain-containing protein, partial [Oleiphilus sp. HI0125]
VLQVLVIYSFAYLFNPFDNRLVTALNVHGKFAKIAILESALNVVLSLVLVQVLGLVGVALGTLLAVIVGKTLKTMHCARVLDVGLVKFVFEPLLPNILPCLISLLLLLVLDSSVNSFIQLFVVVVVTSVIWFFITLFFALSATEKRYVIDLLLRKRIAD